MTAGGHNPGSSGRCKECKERRKKCDLQQPQCLRCRRSGLRCSGPQVNATIFVNRSADAFPAQTQRMALAGAFRQRVNEPSTKNAVTLYQSALQEISRTKSGVENLYLKSTLTANTFILSPQRFLVERTYLALLDEFKPGRDTGIFSGDRVSSSFPKHYSTYATCIRSLLPLASTTITTFDQCNLSLLALYYGRLHGDAGLVDFARSSYTAALNLVFQQLRYLSDGSDQLRTNSMFMSMALLLYAHLDEVDVFGQGHLAHIHGALELLRSCGIASVAKSPETWHAFSGLRAVALFTAIEQRKHTFLAEPEWLYLQHNYISKSVRDQLYDLALEIPGLLASADEITKSLRTNSNRIGSRLISPGLRLINEFAALQRRFEEWLYELKITGDGWLFWSRDDPSTFMFDKDRDSECTPSLNGAVHKILFRSAPVAGFLVQLWTFQLSLLMTSIDLQELLYNEASGPSSSNSDERLTSEILLKGISADRAMAEENANLILEAQPYMSCCLEGLLCLQFPLRIVQMYFKLAHETA